MHIIAIIANLRFQDILDILFLSVVAYHLYLWFQGSKALKALVGLLALGIVFTLARTWGLFMTTWVFQILWQVLVLLLIILFQSEIRQVLERVNPLKAIGLWKFSTPGEWISGFDHQRLRTREIVQQLGLSTTIDTLVADLPLGWKQRICPGHHKRIPPFGVLAGRRGGSERGPGAGPIFRKK